MNELTKEKFLDLDQDKIELLKRTIAKGATDDEFALFLNQCKRTCLDPFSRQIHLVKRKRWNDQKNTWEEVATIQVGIDGYRLIAERTGRYVPGDITYKEKDGILISSTATVFKLYGDKPYPVPAEARFDEYCPRNKEGIPTGLWKKMPYLMIGKCAEALALRRAFPQELSGIYTDAEMSGSDSEDRVAKSEMKEMASKDAKESQKVLNAQARADIETGRLKVATPPVESTAEEIQEEAKEVFGEGPSVPRCPVLPPKPMEVLRKEMDDLIEIQGISRVAFISACVSEFKHVLGDWDATEWGKAVQYLKDMADGKLSLDVAGGQGSFKRFEEPPGIEANPAPKFKANICQEIWAACAKKAEVLGGNPEMILKTASSFTPEGGKLKFLTLADLERATRETKWFATTLKKLDIPEKDIPF